MMKLSPGSFLLSFMRFVYKACFLYSKDFWLNFKMSLDFFLNIEFRLNARKGRKELFFLQWDA